MGVKPVKKKKLKCNFKLSVRAIKNNEAGKRDREDGRRLSEKAFREKTSVK